MGGGGRQLFLPRCKPGLWLLPSLGQPCLAGCREGGGAVDAAGGRRSARGLFVPWALFCLVCAAWQVWPRGCPLPQRRGGLCVGYV